MTASLPVPHEPLPDDPDDGGAPAGDGRIVEFVKNPRNGADSGVRPSTGRTKRAPKARAPRARKPQVVAPDPGPPPPLPPSEEWGSAAVPPRPAPPSRAADESPVLPPKPSVPADVAAAAAAAAAAEHAAGAASHHVDAAEARDIPLDEEAAPETAASEEQPKIESAASVTPDRPAETLPASEREPEGAGTLADTAEPEPAASVEPEPEPEIEPADAVDPVSAEVVEPQPAPQITPEPEPEPDILAELGLSVEPDPVGTPAGTETVGPDVGPAPASVADASLAEQETVVSTLVEPAALDDVSEVVPVVDDQDDPLAYVYEQARLEASVDEESSVLTLRGVSKTFGDMTAVEAIDLTVPAGTFYGLVGPNGAGKTTTLSMIAGLLTPDRGVIRVGGVDASSDPLAAKKLMGVLPDRLRTFDRLTGRQLLYYYGVLRGLPARVVESRSADLARAFDLTDALGRVVSDYSAGMLKKVMLAGAMIHSPRVLVLDEPFESVDPVSSAVILDILSAYVAHGGTVILSSHGMELVERVCTRVAVIVAGQVLAEGTIDDVRGELTLEQRFVELAGGLSDVEGLEWLHTFSD